MSLFTRHNLEINVEETNYEERGKARQLKEEQKKVTIKIWD
jgi:hypothetical protein